MASTNHRPKQRLERLHQARGGGNGKGCLTRHHNRDRGHHCSHQWQGVVHAENDRGVYNYPKYKAFCGTGTFRTGKYESGWPYGYALDKRKPQPGDWNVGHGDNFQTFLRPWWHNAHHIVPNETLATAIADSSTDSLVELLVKLGLLKAEYNLNDQLNMIILPMDKEVAGALGLPRHVNGRESAPRRGDHPDYNAYVKRKVQPVTDEYAKLVKKTKAYKENHPDPPDKLSKARLVNISKRTYNSIKHVGRRPKGKSLDEIFGGR